MSELKYRKSFPKGLVNLALIPMLARYLKIMIMRGSFPEIRHQLNGTEILHAFVDFVVGEQSKKDKSSDKDILKKENEYRLLLPKLRALSLKTLEEGQIYRFLALR